MPLEDGDPVLGTLTYKIKVTEDCALLANTNCDLFIELSGGISGKGAISGVEFDINDHPFIQGYEVDGSCEGRPITELIRMQIDAEDFVNAECENYDPSFHFAFCYDGNDVLVNAIRSSFPAGTRFYNGTDRETATEYTNSNPFPGDEGERTYYAFLPISVDCYYEFTIDITNVTTTPTAHNVEYCVEDAAEPLTATLSSTGQNEGYNLYYLTSETGGNPQNSITPSTSTAGTMDYWVAEGPSANCIGDRVKITVTVHELPAPPVSSGDLTDCAPANLNANDAVTIASGTTIVWYNAATGGDVVSNPVLNEVGSITYYAETVANNCASASRTAVTLTIHGAPDAPASGGDITACEEDPIQTLTAVASVGSGESVVWYESETATTAIDGDPTLSEIGTKTYWAEAVNDATQCVSLARTAVTLTIHAAPIAGAITGEDKVCMEGSINLSSNATGVETLTFTWSSSDENVATVDNSGKVTPVAPGTTKITYTVTDGNDPQCEATSEEFEVTVYPLPVVHCPNNKTVSSCDFEDQEAVDHAFAEWLTSASAEHGTLSDDNSGAPARCGGSVTVTFTSTSEHCGSVSCDATFTITPPEAISYSTLSDANLTSCAFADQAALDAAFADWVSEQTAALNVSGGCEPQISNNSEEVSIPLLCDGGSATVTWTISDLCETKTVSADFKLTAPDEIAITAPEDFSADATEYEDQEAINTAFADWLKGFGVSGGCDPQGSFGNPSAPTLCGASVTVTYNVIDLCETGEKSATFTINSPNELVINEPEDLRVSSCDYVDQDALNDEFNVWLTGFSVSGGFDPVGEFAEEYSVPVLCEGGSVEVLYKVSDACGHGSVTASFTVDAPAAVAVAGPQDVEENACKYADQDALDAAFATWISEFVVTEGGCGVETPDLSGYEAPELCTGGTVEVTYSVSDLCSEASITRSFVIAAPADITYTAPMDANELSCDYADLDAVNAAFADWVSEQTDALNVSGGCDSQVSDNSEEVDIPTLCTGGSATVTWTISDLCETKTLTADFNLSAPAAISYTNPENANEESCDYVDQAALDAAFAAWVDAQTAALNVSGGCDSQVSDNSEEVDIPTLCKIGRETVV